MKDKKNLLPGGAWLVGQNLVAFLKRKGYHNLVVLDKHKVNLKVLRRMHPDITIEEADLAVPGLWSEHFKNADAVVILQAQIEEIFMRIHLSGTILPRQSISSI